MGEDKNDDNQAGRGADPDRAAILARRQHFIAIALSGLATTACTAGKVDAKSDSQGQVPAQAPESAPESASQPPPMVCLKMSDPYPSGETGDATGTGDATETGDGAEPPAVEPAPRPCLKKRPAPKPCLKKAAPDPNDDPSGGI